MIAEPSPRDSMAAIGLAAALLERADPDAVMGSFAADHVIADQEAFAAAVRLAVDAARDGWLVTLGITPTYASTAFGYVHLGPDLPGHDGAYRVAEFVEKPAADVAAGYLATGSYRWNAGMFVVRPSVLLDLLEESHPGFAGALREIAADRSRLDELWDHLPRIAIDHAVAEPAAAAGQVAVVPVSIGWDDIGDFDSLATLLATDGEPVTVLGDPSAGPDGRQLRPGRARLGPGGRGRGARRRRRGGHAGRAAGDDPGARPGRQADRRRPAGERAGRADLTRYAASGSGESRYG